MPGYQYKENKNKKKKPKIKGGPYLLKKGTRSATVLGDSEAKKRKPKKKK